MTKRYKYLENKISFKQAKIFALKQRFADRSSQTRSNISSCLSDFREKQDNGMCPARSLRRSRCVSTGHVPLSCKLSSGKVIADITHLKF